MVTMCVTGQKPHPAHVPTHSTAPRAVEAEELRSQCIPSTFLAISPLTWRRALDEPGDGDDLAAVGVEEDSRHLIEPRRV